jgi:hypothetical protein
MHTRIANSFTPACPPHAAAAADHSKGCHGFGYHHQNV